MTRKEYNNLSGAEFLLKNENLSDVGYVIALGEGENIHIAWLPIDVFEKTYKKSGCYERLSLPFDKLREDYRADIIRIES